jgi:glycopeptide antibiotics resistance protein
MRNAQILDLLNEYLFLGVFISILIILVFFIGYFLIYKKLLKKEKKLSFKKIISVGIFIVYIFIVLSATLLDRYDGISSQVTLQLFSAYKYAWNYWSIKEWRNIILNILLFVPIGMLLPIIFKKLNKFWKVYLISFLITIFIEIFQLVTHRGVFEIDDIFNNTIGSFIGYGLIYLILCIKGNNYYSKEKKVCILLQIPLFFMMLVFLIIFYMYHSKEFGNNMYDYVYKINMENIDVKGKCEFNDDSKNMSIYKIDYATKEELLSLAIDIFKKNNLKIDETQNIEYDDEIYYWSQDGSMTSIRYIGKTYSFNLNGEKVVKILSDFGIEIPLDANYKINELGEYEFNLDMIETNEGILNGNLKCSISKDEKILSCGNNILLLKKVKDLKCISEVEAFNKIKNGEFNLNGYMDTNKITVKSVELTYFTDSKGFYQPNYYFKTDEEIDIFIPAINNLN